jgi:LytS/YehU family sensor histidine kinase
MALLLCWTGLYYGVKFYERLQLEREATLRQSALAQEAQLKMLRYQLNPHFLFNTLNAISTLVLDGQNRTANLAVSRLSEFLRYTLDQDPMKKVTLRQELDALNLYLGIEKLRFGERLRLEFDVDERVESALVPSLLLQPLVENAMKYAIAPREQGGSVTIIAGVERGGLRLAVVDDGPGLPPAVANGNGRGVGLRNTRERLKVLYGDAHSVEVADAAPGLRVEMRLPLEV